MAGMKHLKWVERAPGVWSAQIGVKEPAPMDYAAPPMLEALKQLGAAPMPVGMAEALGDVRGVYTSARIPLKADERLYGLGMAAKSVVNLKGQWPFEMKVSPHNHAPIALYISSAGYGIGFNAGRTIRVWAGKGNRKDSPNHPPERFRSEPGWDAYPHSDAVEANVTGTGMEVFLFAGKTPLEVVRRYVLFSGGGCMPTWWSLGLWHRVFSWAGADSVAEVAEGFASHDLPVDVIGLEPGWQTGSYPCTYEWDPKKFADPAAFLKRMREMGLRVNVWENLHISKRSPLYPVIGPFTGSHTLWGEIPDYTFPEPLNAFLDHNRKNLIDIGVSGFKFDEVDTIEPEHALFPSGLSGEQMRSIQGLIIAKATTELFRKLDRRTTGQVRATNMGGSSYPYATYSDGYGHPQYIQALCNSSLVGAFWCAEVRGAESDEDQLRRYQTALFAPIMQVNGWGDKDSCVPWGRHAAVLQPVRDLVRLRTRLVPYLYTAMADYHTSGIPPIRHMVLEDGFTLRSQTVAGTLDANTNPYEQETRRESADQFMVGPNILVAPMVAKQEKRTVILPAGRWYDFETGALVGDGGAITVTPPVEKIPMFVKDGGIVPMMPATNRVGNATADVPLEVRHYGQKPGSYVLYDDDGVTYGYERGISSRQELRVIQEHGTLKGQVMPAVGPWKPRYGAITFRMMTPTPEVARFAGTPGR
jgi:alpha-glucosidase (family GH31 glycosyl hydrolase)